MEFTHSKIFAPYFNRSVKLKHLKAIKLQSPVKIEEIKTILEQSLQRVNVTEKNVTFNNMKISKIKPVVQKPSNEFISVKKPHFYAKFLKNQTNRPFVINKMRIPSLSPSLRIHKQRINEKTVRKKINIKENSAHQQGDNSTLHDIQLSKSSRSSSISEFSDLYKTRYH